MSCTACHTKGTSCQICLDRERAVRKTRAAVAEVKALHHEYRGPFDEGRYCAHCNQLTGSWIPYPCPTVEALGELA